MINNQPINNKHKQHHLDQDLNVHKLLNSKLKMYIDMNVKVNHMNVKENHMNVKVNHINMKVKHMNVNLNINNNYQRKNENVYIIDLVRSNNDEDIIKTKSLSRISIKDSNRKRSKIFLNKKYTYLCCKFFNFINDE